MQDAGSVRTIPASAGAETPLRQIRQWGLVWRRFRHHRLALLGARVFLALLFLALVGPLIAPPLVIPNPIRGINVPYWMYQQRDLPPQLWPWHWRLLLGTDSNGNAVLSWVLDGARATLAIGLFGSLLASLIGAAIGGVAGYLGGAVDAFLMRVVDTLLAIPFLLLLVLLSLYLPDHSLPMYILLFGLVGWPGVARLVRSSCLSLRQREFVEAARALGASSPRIIARHLLPGALDVLLVATTLNMAVFVVAEATMDFLQAGPEAVTWGKVLVDAYNGMLSGYWWLSVFPGLALLLTVLAVNFLGDGLRDALEPGSATAFLMDAVGSKRVSEPGPMQRALIGALGRAAPVRAGFAGAVAHAQSRMIGVMASHRVQLDVDARLERWVTEKAARDAASRPRPGHLIPIAGAFLLVALVFLYGNSPLRYAPSFAPPTAYTTIYGESEYAIWPRRDGALDMFLVDAQGQLAYQRFDRHGRMALDQPVVAGSTSSQPSMAESAGRSLGAWVGNESQTIYATFLGAQRRRIFALNPPGGIAEHPNVVPAGRGFAVLFDWQRPGRSAFDLYLALVPVAQSSAPPRVAFLRRLVSSGDYALYPRAVVDGSGKLDVLYLRRVDRDRDIWSVLFRRFDMSGRALGFPLPLGLINLLQLGPNGCTLPDGVPFQWALDVKRSGGGSIWAAWETGTDCVSKSGVSGSNALSIAHWSRTGRLLLRPAVVDPRVDASSQAVALALQGKGGQLYFPQPGEVEPFILSARFNGEGRLIGQERVAYDGGGMAANPRAGSVAGRPIVIWEKIRSAATILEGTRYRPARPPDLLTRLGLNIGTPWGNILLLVIGALGAGVGLTLINIFLLLPLIPVWLLLQRLIPGVFRWRLFVATIALLLAGTIALPSSLPGFVLILGGLTGSSVLAPLYRWLAVAGATFVASWTGRSIMVSQEGTMRATAMAILSLYFVSVMYAVVFIQGQLGRI